MLTFVDPHRLERATLLATLARPIRSIVLHDGITVMGTYGEGLIRAASGRALADGLRMSWHIGDRPSVGDMIMSLSLIPIN